MTADQPPAIVPMPASLFPDLRGRRVIVGVPGIGFRADLRADDPVLNGSRTFIPALAEQDYYRAEIEQIEVFVPLVPIERVWVEHLGSAHSAAGPFTGPLDAPMPRYPIAVTASTRTLGLRVVQQVPDGFVRDLRAVTDPYGDSNAAKVRICGEEDWYRWAIAGATPSYTAEVLAKHLWLE